LAWIAHVGERGRELVDEMLHKLDRIQRGLDPEPAPVMIENGPGTRASTYKR
jgi:hypothetical protein